MMKSPSSYGLPYALNPLASGSHPVSVRWLSRSRHGVPVPLGQSHQKVQMGAFTRRSAMPGMSLAPPAHSSASTACSAAIRWAARRVRGGRSTNTHVDQPRAEPVFP
jgi:hypothetical protein